MDLIIRYKQEMQITLQNKTGENLSMSENVRQVQAILNVRNARSYLRGVRFQVWK